MDRLPDRTTGRKRDAHSVASSPSPPPSCYDARTTPNSAEPSHKRIRREEANRDTTVGRPNGHTYSNGFASDQAQVQYGDRISNVYNNHGWHSSLRDEKDGPDYVAQALEDLAFAKMEERRDTISKSYSNTCEWLFQKQEYLSWRDSAKMSEHYGFFWIKSKPGAGKSTLMKFFFKSAKEQLPEDNVISFFFNARGEELEKSLEGLYRSLIYQLLTKIPRLQHHLRATRNSTSRHQNWSLESLKSVFAEAVMHLEQDRLTCLIDALDECPEVEIREMIDFFEELGESAADKKIELRVCFSSRHYPHVTINKCQDMLLDGQAGHEEDITKYLKSKLKARKGKTGEELRQAVQAKAQGVFMWLVLVVRILNKESDRGSNNASLRKCLAQIPNELHELFEDILQRGIRNDENLVPILQWVSFAQRPLSCEELYFAVRSGRPDFDVAKRWDQDEDDIEMMKLFILNSSKGLAELTRGKKPTVQFIHESVRDYLRETGFRVLAPDLHSSLLGSTHEYLKRCCSRWIADSVIEQLSLPKDLPKAKSQEGKELREKAATYFPFLDYSVNHLVQHADLASSHGILQASFVDTFPLSPWIILNDVLAIYNTRRYGSDIETMWIFLDKGAWCIIGHQLTQGWSPSKYQCRRMLEAAITIGNIEILRLILDNPAQCPFPTEASNELVHHAIDKGDAMALRIILSRATCRGTGDSHLSKAYRTMDLSMMQELLSWPSLEADDQWTAIVATFKSSIRGDEPVLSRFLMDQLRELLGDVERAKLMIDRLVCWLAEQRPESYGPIVKVLIETGLATNAGGAVVSACVQGCDEIFYSLVEQGCHIGAMDSTSYFDALSGAARNGHRRIVDTLLTHDAGMELQDADSYRIVVQAVTMARHEDVLTSLFDWCGGVRAQDPAIYRDSLRQATEWNLHEIVQILRERGVTLPEDEP